MVFLNIAFNRIFHSSQIAKFCFLIIAIQILIILFLYFGHCFSILIQIIVGPYQRRRHREFSQTIEYLLFASYFPFSRKIVFPKCYWFERKVLREIIYNYMIEIKGEAKQSLFTIYRELGFLKDDLNQCLSSKWSIRLNAVVRLQHIGFKESEQALSKLVDDPYPLISSIVKMHFSQSEGNHG